MSYIDTWVRRRTPNSLEAILKSAASRQSFRQKSNRTATIRYCKRLRQRNCIERVIGHLKINHAVAARYDQLADRFLGMLYIATVRYWIKFTEAEAEALIGVELLAALAGARRREIRS